VIPERMWSYVVQGILIVVTPLWRWQYHEYDYERSCVKRKLIELNHSL